MKTKRRFNLLTKTSVLYLVFTFTVFFLFALFLYIHSDRYIENILEQRFILFQNTVEENLRKDPSYYGHSTIVTSLDSLDSLDRYPAYYDSIFYADALEEMQHFRVKFVVVDIDGRKYCLKLAKQAGDFYKFRDAVAVMLIPAFMILALILFIINYMLSGYLFKPFNRILNQMRIYKVGLSDSIETVETNTSEFQNTQMLFHRMIARIEEDYCKLKEYTENMAHDIQTPLTIICNKTENLLADEPLMERHSGDVKIIYDQAMHLSSLSRTLNLLTKIENSEFTAKEMLRTLPFIEKHVAAVQELAQLKSMSVETQLDEKHSLKIDP